MMRFGYAADKDRAVSLYKQKGNISSGIVLSGFGTEPVPGTVAEDAIQSALQFTALYIQKAIDMLAGQSCQDLTYAGEIISLQMSRISNRICYFSQKVGQGIYLRGSVFYAVHNRYTCLPFGGGGVWHCSDETFTKLRNTDVEADNLYIRDAIGGAAVWKGAAQQGTLEPGQQLILATYQVPDSLIQSILEALASVDPEFIASTVYENRDSNQPPCAILSGIWYETDKYDEFSLANASVFDSMVPLDGRDT